jgi:hypothetical protein
MLKKIIAVVAVSAFTFSGVASAKFPTMGNEGENASPSKTTYMEIHKNDPVRVHGEVFPTTGMEDDKPTRGGTRVDRFSASELGNPVAALFPSQGAAD